ncbi:hypothetical protein T265_08771 [Opisthorchis viverrini]|uniref:Trematode PH-like domain-containing protein n=1 Tax=Opisthorchis viverrini TaxID=6198 RepID=A0A074Z7Z2_OPIVI|nr:hypothetical protein T265_08771 [Opisthorchis viverrini]KER23326.1 hypothetical protein T265_08771 [Opisthorchis viverrini]
MTSKDVELNPLVNQPVDKKSKQVVNKEIPVAQLGRTKLKDSEAFNDRTANNLLDKHLKKKGKPSPVFFLVDRMRFKKKGHHEYLNYREVHSFHKFANHPNVFMLFVIEEKKGKRSYETYSCNNSADVQCIRDMIGTIQDDPKRLLQGLGPVRVVSLSSSSSSEYHIERRLSNRSSQSRSVAYRPYSQQEPAEYLYIVDPEQSTGQQTLQPVQKRVSNGIINSRMNSFNGSQAPDHGPVYVYGSRSSRNLYRDGYSPEYSRRKYC